MQNRLIVVADYEKAHFFKAKGRKIHEKIQEILNEAARSHEPRNRREGLSQRMSLTGHFLNPHTALKDAEKENFARHISQQAYKRMSDDQLDEMILVAEPKMLGLLRKSLKHYYTNAPIYKTLNLDITSFDINAVEDKVFS
jgi:protein required for attachment to host cells